MIASTGVYGMVQRAAAREGSRILVECWDG